MTLTATPPPKRRGPVDRFNRRHDHVSEVRQKLIANLTLFVNVLLAGAYLIAIEIWDWRVTMPADARAVALACWALGLLGMVAASSVPMQLLSLPRAGQDNPKDVVEPRWLCKARKWLFYPASYLLLIAVALWVEMTGGLVRSPFTPVLFAMVLSAQQLSRFRLNSGLFIGFGVLAAGALALYEWQEAILVPLKEEAPPGLDFLFLTLAFGVTAMCAHVAKSPNFRAAEAYPQASDIELFRTRDGGWHFVLQRDGSRIDPRLPFATAPATVDDAQNQVDRDVALLFGEAVSIKWKDPATPDVVSGTIVTS